MSKLMPKIDFGPSQRRRVRTFANAPDTLNPVYGSLKRETPNAYLIEHRLGPMWLPKSRVKHNLAGQFFLVPNWLIRKKGLDLYQP